MPPAVYMHVHVPAAVTEDLRRKLLEVRTAQADASGRLSDEELLVRATTLGGVLLTQDADFLEITARWQHRGIPFGRVDLRVVFRLMFLRSESVSTEI